NLNAEIVHVPLIVRFPEGSRHVRADEHGRVAQPAGHLDLWPTIVEALSAGQQGNRGLSLFRGELPEQRFLKQTLGRFEKDRWMAFGDGRWRMVAQWGEAPRLYDRASDPGETIDLAAKHPEVLKELARLHAEDKAAHPLEALPEQRIDADPEAERKLDALGYAASDE